ncbi:alpha/beta hydrolase [Mucilaginibacter sp. UC70_90]
MKTQINITKLTIAAAAVFLSTFSPKNSLAQTAPAVKNIVIVHGAFADASGWEGVYRILKKDGYNVTLVQNPLTSLNDDVAATNRALEKQDGPAVLVGHSWGGSVITEAGVSPKVASLVYVAAFAPEVGQSTLDVYQSGPALAKNGILPADRNGLVYFDKALFQECFAADLNEAKADFMFDSQQPIVGSSFVAPLTQAAWKIKPAYGIVATMDKAINPELERAMYKRAGAVVTEVKGSHVIFISQAAAVARVIETAAKNGPEKK